MVSADITGIGWVTATGMGCAKDHLDFAMPDGPLPDITHLSALDKSYPYLRRMDQYSKLGLNAIAFALKDAGLGEWTQKRNIGIIVATVYGCLHTDIDYFDTVMPQNGIGASPALFSYTLPNSFLGEAAIRFGLTGITFVINEPVPLNTTCLQLTLDSIACGEADKMLCGICDLGGPPSLGVNLNLSPGAVFFMLEKSPEKNASSYGTIRRVKDNRIMFGQTEIKDLTTLVQKCQRNYRTFQDTEYGISPD